MTIPSLAAAASPTTLPAAFIQSAVVAPPRTPRRRRLTPLSASPCRASCAPVAPRATRAPSTPESASSLPVTSAIAPPLAEPAPSRAATCTSAAAASRPRPAAIAAIAAIAQLVAPAVAVLAAVFAPPAAARAHSPSLVAAASRPDITLTANAAAAASPQPSPVLRLVSSAERKSQQSRPRTSPRAQVALAADPLDSSAHASPRRSARDIARSLQTAVQKLTLGANDGGENGDSHGHSAAVNDALVLLLTTVVIVPLMRLFGISPILGFLAAGIALGPNGFALIRDVRTSKALAELGVVFFLFEMGLELSTAKLQSLGRDVFGLGTTQFFTTGAIFTMAAALLARMTSPSAIVVGAGLALSSSAFVLQLLAERGEISTRFGRAAFGILLFQDLAVVPVLVLTPLLASSGGASAVASAMSVACVKASAALVFIFLMGKYVLQPAFSFVAASNSDEAFTAAVLFTVLATSSLTQVLGLSDTLGAFLAGVILAETKFRDQVEADIKPFRGLLLGLFFITVGFSIDLNLAAANLVSVLGMVSGLMVVKAGIIAVAAVGFGHSAGSAIRTGLLLSQGGEFAFVVYGLATSVGVLSGETAQLMLLVVALSMAMTPFMADIGRRISASLPEGAPALPEATVGEEGT